MVEDKAPFNPAVVPCCVPCWLCGWFGWEAGEEVKFVEPVLESDVYGGAGSEDGPEEEVGLGTTGIPRVW